MTEGWRAETADDAQPDVRPRASSRAYQHIRTTAVPLDPNTNPVSQPHSYAVAVCRRLGTMAGSRCVQTLFSRVCGGNRLVSQLLQCYAAQAALQAACLKRLVLCVPYLGQSAAAAMMAAVSVAEVEAVAQRTFLQSAGGLGAGGTLVVVSCEFLCRQGMNTVWLLKGQLRGGTYTQKTIKNAIGAVGGVGGSATGTMLGSAVAPGLGTGLGCAIGGFMGSYLAEMCARNVLHLTVTAAPASPSGDEWDVEVEEEVEEGEPDSPGDGGLAPPAGVVDVELFVCFEPPAEAGDWVVVEDDDSGCAVWPGRWAEAAPAPALVQGLPPSVTLEL
eukprot:EG_transcript_16629